MVRRVHQQGGRRTRARLGYLLVVVLVVAGTSACSEEARQDIGDRIKEEVGSGTDQPAAPATEVATEAAPEPEPVPETEAPVDAPATEPAPETETATDPAEGNDLWPWILVGLLVLVTLLGLMGMLRRGRQSSANVQQLRDTALAQSQWLVEVASEQAAAVDAAARARDVHSREDRLKDVLAQLEQGTRGQRAQAVARLRASSSRLADALVTRLDDAAGGRPSDEGAATIDLAEQVREDREQFTRVFR